MYYKLIYYFYKQNAKSPSNQSSQTVFYADEYLIHFADDAVFGTGSDLLAMTIAYFGLLRTVEFSIPECQFKQDRNLCLSYQDNIGR